MKGDKKLELKDLTNRVYEGQQCTEFDLKIELPEEFHHMFGRDFRVYYTKNIDYPSKWAVKAYLDSTLYTDTWVCEVEVDFGAINMDLIYVAATGLTYIQEVIKMEMQLKSYLDIILGGVTAGVVSRRE